mmetsp:Transcript_99592/g.281005  ORF Transcript_99592/g.281005 Transcript_99592/m.281005 type:complete len:489 (+) Transcript_99592:64-1530(+)
MGITDVFLRPVRVAVRTVFYPVDWLLFWDVMTPRVKRFGTVNTLVADVRCVLCDYFDYQASPTPAWLVRESCGFCPGTARFWCVECSERLCAACTARRHHPSSFAEQHSIEEMKEEASEGMPLLSPLLPDVLLLLFVLSVVLKLDLGPNYMFSVNVCPVVDMARSGLGYIDTKLMYYMKGSLATYCGIEDSFYKLFADGIIRNVVIDTDDTLLLISTWIPALLFQTVVVYIIVPISAVFYTSAMLVVTRIERCIPENDLTKRMLSVTQGFARWSTFQQRANVPPNTFPRSRDAKDVIELWLYWKGRVTRHVMYYYHGAIADITYVLKHFVGAMVLFRFFCIWTKNVCGFNFGRVIRWVLSLFGLRSFFARMQSTFEANATNILDDGVLLQSFWRLAGFTSGIVYQMPFIVRCLMTLLVLAPFVGAWALIFKILFQRREFNARWPHEGARIVGPCGEFCACSSCGFFASKATLRPTAAPYVQSRDLKAD